MPTNDDGYLKWLKKAFVILVNTGLQNKQPHVEDFFY